MPAKKRQRPREALGPYFYPAKITPYTVPSEQLWKEFEKRFPAGAQTWEGLGATYVVDMLTWWWKDSVERSPGDPRRVESTINELFKAEFDLYKFHTRKDEPQLRIMRHSITQQLLRQDPAMYRLAVTLRADQAWKLVSLSLLIN